MRLLVLFVFVSNCVYATTDTTRYEVVSSGKITGKLMRWSNEAGHVAYHYEYNDRGRGPQIVVNLKTAGDGMVTERIAKGHDYFKAPVEETYAYANGVAQWKNNIENDKRNAEGKLLYSPLNGVPAEIELALRSLLKAPNHQLDI